MKCQSPTEIPNRAHMERVIAARRAREDRLIAEAHAAGRTPDLKVMRPHHILNRTR